MRTLRSFFLTFGLREKVLLVGFVLMIAVVLGANFNRRAWKFKREASMATLDLKMQQHWLDNQAAIEAAAQKTAARLDPARTLDASSLLATVSRLAGEAGVNARTVGESRDETNGQFNVHTREFQIDKVDHAAVVKFYLSLQALSPYIGIELFTEIADRGNPALNQVILRVSAPEVVR